MSILVVYPRVVWSGVVYPRVVWSGVVWLKGVVPSYPHWNVGYCLHLTNFHLDRPPDFEKPAYASISYPKMASKGNDQRMQGAYLFGGEHGVQESDEPIEIMRRQQIQPPAKAPPVQCNVSCCVFDLSPALSWQEREPILR